MWSCQCQHWFIMEGLSFLTLKDHLTMMGMVQSSQESVDAIETSHMSLEQKNVETFDEMWAAKEEAIWRVLCSHLEDNVILWVPFHKSNSIWSFYLLAHANCALMSQQHKWWGALSVIQTLVHTKVQVLPPNSNTHNRRGLVIYNPTHGSTAMKNICRMNTLGVHKATLDFDEGAIECRHKPRNISLSLLHPLLISLVKALAIQELTMLKSSGK